MWSHIRLQSKEAPLNMIPTLSYKPTPTSMSLPNYPSTRSVISAPTSVFLQKTQGTLWAAGSRWSIEVSRRGFIPPPGGDFGGTRNPACFVWEAACYFDEQEPLKVTVRIHSNQSQPRRETNASHGDRHAAAHSPLCSCSPAAYLLWECRQPKVSELSSKSSFQPGPSR